MKNFRLKTIYFCLIMTCIISTSCDSSKDGKIVKDASGKYYKLEYRTGVVYKVEEIDINQIDSLQSEK